MAHLVIKEDGQERTLALTGDVTMGRSRKNPIALNTKQSSREHCRVVKVPTGWKVVDLESSNGTFVNGLRVQEIALSDGDAITVGTALITFYEKDPAPPTAGEDSKTEAIPLRDRNVEILLKAVLAASTTKDFGAYLRLAVDSVIDIVHAERGILFLADGNVLHSEVSRTSDRQDLVGAEDISKSIPQRVLTERRAVYLLDAGSESAMTTRSAAMHRLKTVMCAPLQIGERVLGVLYVDSRTDPRTYDAADLALFEAVTNYIALTIQNVRSAEDAKKRDEAHRAELAAENQRLRAALAHRKHFFGECAAMKEVYERIRKVAPTDATVLVAGESGTGKEAIAHIIHDLSPRSTAPFVVIDCAAIPETLLESELFGYEKGAFTGALQQKPGKFEMAQGGTVFLDEIGELPLSMQVKLLRVIEQREMMRVGGVESIGVDCRIVAATNRGLEDLVAKGQFRQDLLFRLKVITIALPPLRERGGDILLLADQFLKTACEANHRQINGFTREARDVITRHRWEGNVRELKHRIEQAVILAEGEALGPEDLHLGAGDEEFRPLDHARDQFERKYILKALAEYEFNVSQTARQLGISRQHLQNLMKKHNIQRGETE